MTTKEAPQHYPNRRLYPNPQTAPKPRPEAPQKPFVGHLLKLHLADNPDSLILERRNSFLSFCATFNHLPVDHLTVENLASWFSDLRTKQGYGNKRSPSAFA